MFLSDIFHTVYPCRPVKAQGTVSESERINLLFKFIEIFFGLDSMVVRLETTIPDPYQA